MSNLEQSYGPGVRLPALLKYVWPFRYVVDYIMFFGTYYESEVDGIVSSPIRLGVWRLIRSGAGRNACSRQISRTVWAAARKAPRRYSERLPPREHEGTEI